LKHRRLRSFAAVLAIAALVAGCREQLPPGDDLPPGTLVIARSESLQRLLARLTQLEGTRIAASAAALASALPDCPWVEGQVPSGDPADVWSQLRCRAPDSPLAALERERGERDIAFALPAKGAVRPRGSLAVAANGDVVVELLLPPIAFANTRALLLPAAESPGPALLNHADEIAHARLRPEGGLDIASLVPASSQADRMFRLKSELFAGAVLDGTWEIAVYLPEPGRPMPRSALAVGFALKQPAVAAIEGFVSDLQNAWPVRRSDFAVGAFRGACLLDLNILPDLAPCYAATEDALVIGWNPASVRQALAADGADEHAGHGQHPHSGITIDLARIPEADARLAQLAAENAPVPATGPYPWQRLRADGVRDGDVVRVRVELHGEAGA